MSIFNPEIFIKALEDQLKNVCIGITPKELVEDFFKASLAKLLEVYLMDQGRDTVAADYVDTMVRETISCFRNAELGTGQHSEAEYEALTQKTMQEIAAGAHSGGAITTETESQGMVRSDGGLYVPGHLAR